MLNNIQKDFQSLINSLVFKNETGYLISCFVMADTKKLKEQTWQFNFYDPETKTINSYTNNKITDKKQEIYKKEKIKELKIKDIKISFKEAFKEAQKHIKEPVNKIICIIQNHDIPLYSITFLTVSIKMKNIKISASDKTVIEIKEENLLNLQPQ